MPRSGRIRAFIREYKESPRLEKMSFIPPFIILALEVILIVHAYLLNEGFVFILTAILLTISMIEILLVTLEIHEQYQIGSFDREMTIRLDDFIIERNAENVTKTVEEFIEIHPDYNIHRNEIYHIACQIMDTHKAELWEKTLTTRMKKFIPKSENKTVKEIIGKFVEKYPEYRKDPEKVYHLAIQILEKSKKRNFKIKNR
jgi:hypothetical protein